MRKSLTWARHKEPIAQAIEVASIRLRARAALWGTVAIVALPLLNGAPRASADPPPPRKTPVKLDPPSVPTTAPAEREFTLDGWHYRVQRGQAEGGVPWELIVTPSGPDAEKWRREEMIGVAPTGRKPAGGRKVTGKTRVKNLESVVEQPQPTVHRTLSLEEIPTIKVPDIVWTGWMAKDLQDVVGIHFHELKAANPAQILFTLHKVPADGPDGKPPADYKGRFGSRLEATLLAPIEFQLDQTVVVRDDRLKKDMAQKRAEHEVGHAGMSHEVLLASIAGPETWDEAACKGRRARVTYYWKREKIGRSWDGYRDASTKLLTAKTTLVVVPPTRWSMLLPLPPQKVTQKHLDAFNEATVLTTAKFAIADREAQARFHAEHGEFEANEQGH